MNRFLLVGIALVVTGLAALAVCWPQSPAAEPSPTAARSEVSTAPPLTRETRAISIGGRPEEWRLVWREKPMPVCSPADVVMAPTCPCEGVAYGEYGHLALQRWQAGNLVESLDLGSLYGQFDGPGDIPPGMIPLRRKPRDSSHDHEIGEASLGRLVAEVAGRPDSSAIQFADYDHDGVAAEFLLQVGTIPCGKLQFVAVGVSRADPRLHPFATAAHPDRPLVMPRRAWEALLGNGAPRRVVAWECDDHGSEVHRELEVSASAGRISARDLVFACPFDPSSSKPPKIETL